MRAIVLLVVGTVAACAAPEPPRGAPTDPPRGGPRSTTTTAPSSTTIVAPSTTTSTPSTPSTTTAPSTTTSSTVRPNPGGTIELVTHVPGPEGYFGSSSTPAISPDGRYVAFASTFTDLIPGETTEAGVFLWDATTDSIVRIGAGRGPAISPDGGHIAFSADTSKPVTEPDSIGFIADVFIWDAASNSITQVTDGDQSSYAPATSVGGSTIAFSSSASNLVEEPANGYSDVYLWTRSEVARLSGSSLARWPRVMVATGPLPVRDSGRQ